ncbi:hypothetical protein EDB84DRAFT_1475708 [Lactarius hengduanensis]|nr:hypothetical protein EDB84DRAFT_1475708 [Lactarius hengduanensis]
MRLGVPLHTLLIVLYEVLAPARHFLSIVLAASHKYFMPLISKLIRYRAVLITPTLAWPIGTILAACVVV